MELKFKTKVDVEIDYDSLKPKGFEYEDRDSSTEVSYVVTIETREWGIKSMSYQLINQEIFCYITLLDKNKDESDSFLFKITITDSETESPENLSGDLSASLLSLTLNEIEKINDKTFSAKASALLSF